VVRGVCSDPSIISATSVRGTLAVHRFPSGLFVDDAIMGSPALELVLLVRGNLIAVGIEPGPSSPSPCRGYQRYRRPMIALRALLEAVQSPPSGDSWLVRGDVQGWLRRPNVIVEVIPVNMNV